MPPLQSHRPHAWRRALLAAALCTAATASQAQLISGLLGAVTGTLNTVTGTLDALLEPSGTNYLAKRSASQTAADSAHCRAQERHRGNERLSYGNGSPRHRQLLNDCSLLGPATP